MQQSNTILLLFIFLCSGVVSSAQTPGRNYVRHDKSVSSTDIISTVQYYDGIGRPTVTAVNSNGAGSAYLYSSKRYSYGQQVSVETLPVQGGTSPDYYSCSDLSGMTGPLYGSDSHAFIAYDYDGLDRLVTTETPGDNWHKGMHYPRKSYGVCGANEVIKFDGGLSYSGFYAAGALTVETVTDEDGHASGVYKDMLGRTVMERRGSDNDTYYVYNAMGLLMYVLPPAISSGLGTSGTVSQDLLSKYGYQYYYDNAGHCTGKTLPGCRRENYELDHGNRVVFSQTGNQSDQGLWFFDLYDSQGRPAVHGLVTSGGGAASYDGHIITARYTGTGIYDGWEANVSLTGYTILQTNYYDDYKYLALLPAGEKSQLSPLPTSPADATGLLTGTRTRYSSTGITASNINTVLPYLTACLYYDTKGRLTQSNTTNILGGSDVTVTDYNFISGSVNTRWHQHTAPGKPVVTETCQYAHDSADRVTGVTYSLNGGTPVTMCEYTYDELGRVKTKRLGGSECIGYSYNIRGWQTGISSDHFEETLSYESATDGLTPGVCAYNGNISAMR